jgi:hypothetical protein
MGSSATARWHPLGTVDGWLRLVVRVVQWIVPFVVAIYAGRRLGRMVRFGGVDR